MRDNKYLIITIIAWVILVVTGLQFIRTLNAYLNQKAHVKAATTSDVISQVNQYRVGQGQSRLTENSTLDQSAQAAAQYDCDNNQWAHTAFAASLTKRGYDWQAAGENLAYGPNYDTVDYFVSLWVASPGHQANMVRSDYRDTGVGVVVCPSFQGKEDQVIIAQHFGVQKPKPVPETKHTCDQ